MEKSDARRAADARYEAARKPVLVRLTEDEAEAIDNARGAVSRPQWIKAKALAAAKRRSK